MSGSKGDQRGRRVAGEITGGLGTVTISASGKLAKRHCDDVGGPAGKREAKRAVSRARRGAPIERD